MAEKGVEIRIEGALLEGSQEADANGKSGMVTIDLIREGFGNPKDRHYYSAQVLEAAAKSFEGAQMFANHLSPELQQKLKGLPRNIQDLMGRIRETWIDQDAQGRTVIRGKASISQKWLWDMVEHDPELLGVSINARGSSVAGKKDGREAKIVEAIHAVGSVDWVSKAGAGGKVFALMEAQATEEGYEVPGDDSAAEGDTDATATATSSTTHHHHHHYESEGAGSHKHRHSHSHPNVVEGEAHTHSEVVETVESISGDGTASPADAEKTVEHQHDEVHEDSMGPGNHLHVHHHHHTVIEGETHSHEGAPLEADSEDDADKGDADAQTAPSKDGNGDAAAATATAPAPESATTQNGDGEPTTEAGADQVFHHYNHHDSMGAGRHHHHHHHKVVAGETHEHQMDSNAAATAARAGSYDDPARRGSHNHHHHHNSMGPGRHIHHHSHNLTNGEAHVHSVDPLVESDGSAEAPEEIFIDEANWIAGAIKHKGALHKDLDIPEGEKIPVSVLEREAKKPGKLGKRARLALILMKVRRNRSKGQPAYATEGDDEGFDWELAEGDVDEEVERRANEMAEGKLREGIKSAAEMIRAEYDKKLKESLAEKDFELTRKVSQLEQRQVAAALIDAEKFPAPSAAALKEEFHDAYFEDKRDAKTGAVQKAGVDVCREAVKGRILKKREELREYTGTRISESGETEDSLAADGDRASRNNEALPKKAPLDAKIDKVLAIGPAATDTDS